MYMYILKRNNKIVNSYTYVNDKLNLFKKRKAVEKIGKMW